MKRLLLLLLPLFILITVASAKNYYVSATGNDNNAGTSPTTSWATLAKVNSFTFAANDSILFHCGDVFYGSIIVKANYLNYSSYGTGAKPLISGFTTLSTWTLLSTGIYQSAVNAKSNLNMVAINGRPQQIGRYPNANAANGGYNTYTAVGTSSITDNTLSASVNWTGAEIAIKKNAWTIDRCKVTSQSGGTIAYSIPKTGINRGTAISSTALVNHGYFFMNDPRTLDQFGEWYFDTVAKKIQIYFGTALPASYSIKVSTVDTLFNIGSQTNINVNNLAFEGANLIGLFSMNGSNVTVQYCNFTNCGARAILVYSTPNLMIESVNTNNVLSCAIQVVNSIQPNVTVRNSVATNTSPFPGMGSFFDDADYKGMHLVASSTILAEYNTIDSVGLSGIQFEGNNVTVRNNFINHYCYNLMDGGGIYSFVAGTDAAPGPIYTNRTVTQNIIMNGIGAMQGTDYTHPDLAGIYMDGRTMNVVISNNTIFNSARNGIHCNNPSNISIIGNTLYNNVNDVSLMRWAWGSITNLNLKRNISFPISSSQNNIYYTNAGLNTPVATTLQANLKSLGSIDSNYYNTFTDASIAMDIYSSSGGAAIPTSPFSLNNWKTFTNYDQSTKRPSQPIQFYSIDSTIGANLFSNSQFTSNINNMTVYGNGTTASWDNTSKISGTGSLRINFSAPVAGTSGLLYSSIGAVSSTKKYVLRVTVLGTTNSGILTAYLRQTASPYTDLVARQTKSFGTTATTMEFLFDSPTAVSDASFLISIDQNSGTTYIDNVQVYQVAATVNTVSSQVKFLYNNTKLSQVYALDATYIGVDSTVYSGSVTLAPFTSKVMVKAKPVVGILPVDLIDFAVKNVNSQAAIKWITTGEINSSHYLVQKSTDGKQFESIGTVQSNNRADVQNTYSYLDAAPGEGLVYYRLAMVDIDGSTTYSKIVAVSFSNTKSFVVENVKVSSAMSTIRLNINSAQAQGFYYQLIDVNGRVLTTKNVQLQVGTNNINSVIPVINRGIYYVKMQTSDAMLTKAVLGE